MMSHSMLFVLAVFCIAGAAQDRFAFPMADDKVSADQAQNASQLGEVTGATCNATMIRQGRSIPLKSFPVKVLEYDELACDENGQMEIQMLDKSTIKIQSNARIRIDKYLLRPQDAGTFTLSLLSGVFRFSSEAFKPKADRYLFNTPTSIIGVRGTIFAAEIKDPKTTLVSVERGEVRVQSIVSKAELFVSKGQKVEATASGVKRVPLK